MPRHHKLPLNDAQLAVLGWIADGCPEGVICDALETEMDQEAPTAEEERAWIAWAREHADQIDSVKGIQTLPKAPEAKPEDPRPFLEGWSPHGPDGR